MTEKSGFWRRCNINYKTIFCVLCAFSSFACQDEPATPSSDVKNRKTTFIKSKEPVSAEKILQKNLQCDELADRIDELNSIVLRQEQTAKQAAEQAIESCNGDSAVDCAFWTERAASLAKQFRELRQEQQKLINRRASKECS